MKNRKQEGNLNEFPIPQNGVLGLKSNRHLPFVVIFTQNSDDILDSLA
jgi:hypothetical protein